MLRKAIASLTLAVAATSAAAVASTPDELKILPNTNLATIAPVLRNAGLTPQTITVNGEESLVIRSGEVSLILRPTVCRPECAGLLMYTLFEGDAPAAVMNSFNGRTPPTVAYTAQGNTVLSRYLIADHGMTTGSFLVNVMVFDNTVTKWLNDSRQTMARSVSLSAEPRTLSNFERETEAYLGEIMSRPELFSGRDHSESY